MKSYLWALVASLLLGYPAVASASEPTTGTLIQISSLSFFVVVGSVHVLRSLKRSRRDDD